MNIIQAENYQDMSSKACSILVNIIKENDKPVLGLATGSTPEGLYSQLIVKNRQGEVSFKNVTTFNLDEYVGLDIKNRHSYHYFMNEKLFNYIDINKEHTHLPNGNALDLQKECVDYDEKIREAGHIDIQILGLGLNGHIGFNEPGTPFSSTTHIVDLDESTRIANSRFFASIDEVPKQAITMGINSIMKSKQILLLVSGEKKAKALDRLLNGEVSEDFPASILQNHENVTIIADKAALGK